MSDCCLLCHFVHVYAQSVVIACMTCRAGSGEKILVWTYSLPSPSSLFPFHSPNKLGSLGSAVSSPPPAGSGSECQPYTHDTLSLENVFGGNKTVSVYSSRQNKVAVGFRASQRSADTPYHPTLSTDDMQVSRSTELCACDVQELKRAVCGLACHSGHELSRCRCVVRVLALTVVSAVCVLAKRWSDSVHCIG